MVEVEQVDREAAAAYYYSAGGSPKIADLIKGGERDDWFRVQAFARHRLAALTPAPAWRTMDSAPRDGGDILLFHTTHGPIAGRFAPGEWSEETPLSPREYSGAVWVLGDDIEQVEVEEGPDRYYDGAITAWMPLPAAPGDGE